MVLLIFVFENMTRQLKDWTPDVTFEENLPRVCEHYDALAVPGIEL